MTSNTQKGMGTGRAIYLSIGDDIEKLRKYVNEKKNHLARPLYRESTKKKGVLSKTLRKRKRRDTRHNTQRKKKQEPQEKR